MRFSRQQSCSTFPPRPSIRPCPLLDIRPEMADRFFALNRTRKMIVIDPPFYWPSVSGSSWDLEVNPYWQNLVQSRALKSSRSEAAVTGGLQYVTHLFMKQLGSVVDMKNLYVPKNILTIVLSLNYCELSYVFVYTKFYWPFRYALFDDFGDIRCDVPTILLVSVKN